MRQRTYHVLVRKWFGLIVAPLRKSVTFFCVLPLFETWIHFYAFYSAGLHCFKWIRALFSFGRVFFYGQCGIAFAFVYWCVSFVVSALQSFQISLSSWNVRGFYYASHSMPQIYVWTEQHLRLSCNKGTPIMSYSQWTSYRCDCRLPCHIQRHDNRNGYSYLSQHTFAAHLTKNQPL